MMPFPLGQNDSIQFMNDIGPYLGSIPQWGSIVQWQNRYILVFQKVDGSYALSDISGGIPDSGVPGGMIPAQALVANTPTEQIGQLEAFLYALPGNFMDIARQRLQQIADTAGSTAADLTKPLLPELGLLAVVGVAILVFMYGSKRG